jgi:large repetitive protein
VLTTITVVSVAEQPAAAAPALTVSVGSDQTVLIGQAATVSIDITNGTATAGYNTGVAVVLESGVSFGSGALSPLEFADTPGAGQTTLWFENINDSQPASIETLTFTVVADTGTFPVGADFDVAATAYTSDDPRVVPTVTGTGSTGTGTDTSTADVTAIAIEKSEPNPEAELMRGVHDHDHDTVYTLTVENNPTNATTSVLVDDYLPAGLEFLGCGTDDNTTDAPTFAGNNVEYTGAARLDVSTDDIVTDCPAPTLVETVQLDPDGAGPMVNAAYTHVQWNLVNFAIGETKIINYAAGVPIRENTLTFPGAVDTTGQQTANLDNNSGAETTDEQLHRNFAEVAGTYAGPLAPGTSNPVGVSDTHDITSEDLRLLKSVNPSVIEQGTDSVWTLTITTSEYRTADDLVVTDTLPNGHRPLSLAVNYDSHEADCAPGIVDPSLPYTGVTENADGTWTLV